MVDILVGGVLSRASIHQDDGGPVCAGTMTGQYRLAVSAVSVLCHIALLVSITGPHVIKRTEKTARAPTRLEFWAGVLQLVVVCLEGGYKFSARKLLFMLNPCHVVGAWQSFLLLTDWKLWKAKAFVGLIGWSFCPCVICRVMAMLFPAPGDTTIPFEMEVFWLEHIFCGLVSPAVLALSGRYQVQLSSWKDVMFVSFIQGHSVFVVYQRTVLFGLSSYFWLNMNFTLCAASSDPLYPIIGHHYYFISEAYLAFGSFFCAWFLYGTLSLLGPKQKAI